MIFLNAGKGCSILYPHSNPFTVNEILKHIDINIWNRLTPSLQTEMEFQTYETNEDNESDFISEKFGPRAALLYCEVKVFLVTVDPTLLTPPRKLHHNLKVTEFYHHAIKITKD